MDLVREIIKELPPEVVITGFGSVFGVIYLVGMFVARVSTLVH
jgi:hypothetical protein